MTRRRTQAIPAHMLTGAYFTELIRAHNFPPMFESRTGADPKYAVGPVSINERERQVTQGIGWGSGTTVLPGTPGNKRPGWMAGSGTANA